MKIKVFLVPICAALAACQSNPPIPSPTVKEIEQRREAEKLSAVAQAEKETSPARGTKSCIVVQYTSAYLVKQKYDVGGLKFGNEVSELQVKVYADGRVGIGMSIDTYPGTTSYFLIAGRRYSARANSYVILDQAGLIALKRDEKIDYSWTTWPYNTEGNRADILAGFDAAYQDCLQFLRGGA